MSKIIKFSYWASIPIFLAVILYVYALLPNEIGVWYDDNGTAQYLASKSFFFYIYFGLFILTNALIYAYQKMAISSTDISMDAFSELSFKEITHHWLTGLSWVFNLIYILSSFYIGLYNSRDVNPDHYVALVYLCPIVLISWIFYFIYLRVTKR